MIRLLFDQGLPRRAVVHLREFGWDVVHVAERGMATASDEQILELARVENRFLATLDKDFTDLLAAGGGNRPSVILFRLQRLNWIETIELTRTVVERYHDVLVAGAVLSVGARTVRVRMLPL